MSLLPVEISVTLPTFLVLYLSMVLLLIISFLLQAKLHLMSTLILSFCLI